MKKVLFFILAAAICVSLAAQTKAYSHQEKAVTAKAQKHLQSFGDKNDDTFIPTQRPANYAPINKSVSNGFLSDIAESFYTGASNACARNTISWSPDGATCASVWTNGGEPTGATAITRSGLRGTGITYYNQATHQWDPNMGSENFFRIEDGPLTTAWAPGWGVHLYTDEGECVLSHCNAANGILVNYKEKRGEGEWDQSVIVGPLLSNNRTGIFWPTACAVGNTIHMVCVTDQDAKYINGDKEARTYPLYFRSTDGGKTWEDFKTFEGIMTERELYDDYEISADDYVIAARGNHVVLAYVTNFGTCYVESKDGGTTWERKLAYECHFDYNTSGIFQYPTMVPTTAAVAIGDDDVVHIAFSATMRMRSPDTQVGYYQFWSTFNGLFTWNDTKPTLMQEDLGIHYDTIANEGTMGMYDCDYFDLPFFLNAPDLLGFGEFVWWSGMNNGGNMIPDNNRSLGYISNPRLLAQDGKVYLLYCSIIEEPMIYMQKEQFFRGVFLTVSYDNGNTYDQMNNTSWLSYHPDLFWCDDWSTYLPIFEGEEIGYDGEIFIYPASESAFPSMSTNIKNNTLVITWFNDVAPFPESIINDQNQRVSIVWHEYPFTIFGMVLPVSQAGVYSNTQQIWKGYWNVAEKEVIDNLKVYPNPAANIATIEVGTNNPYTLTVTNIMGQVVQTVKGQKSMVELNVSNYPAGIYIINVRTAHATASQKLIVK